MRAGGDKYVPLGPAGNDGDGAETGGGFFIFRDGSIGQSVGPFPEKKLCASDVFCPNPHTASYFETSGRLKLTVLSEDRLQMKWKEADGPVQGYKVRVRPISGEATAQPPAALRRLITGRDVGGEHSRAVTCTSAVHPVFQTQILFLFGSNGIGKQGNKVQDALYRSAKLLFPEQST